MQLLGVVVDAIVDAAVYSVADTKVTERSGATIIDMGIKMITEMVFNGEKMLGCAIDAIGIVDEMTPILLDFMPLRGVILALLPCLMTMIIGNFQEIPLVLQLALYPLREAEWALKPKDVRIFLK